MLIKVRLCGLAWHGSQLYVRKRVHFMNIILNECNDNTNTNNNDNNYHNITIMMMMMMMMI